ncbi:hypothetical protein KCP71_22365 [Salmonella enterica subsp. enterica]|nr:hypothetical protein KCP71_22365 [Salmonella enterica subsp. enterica]
MQSVNAMYCWSDIRCRGQRGTLTGRRVRTDLLMRLEPFVRLSAHRRQRRATREIIEVAGADGTMTPAGDV